MAPCPFENLGRTLSTSTCHGRTLGWTATCFSQPVLQCTSYCLCRFNVPVSGGHPPRRATFSPNRRCSLLAGTTEREQLRCYTIIILIVQIPHYLSWTHEINCLVLQRWKVMWALSVRKQIAFLKLAVSAHSQHWTVLVLICSSRHKSW